MHNIHHGKSDENYKTNYNILSETKDGKKKVNKSRKRNNLAFRSDVMNKNIIRAVKRESKRMYERFIELKSLSKSTT